MLNSTSLTVPVLVAMLTTPVAVFAGPDWLQDFRAQSTWISANDLRLEQFKCYGHKLALTGCYVSYSNRLNDSAGSNRRQHHLLGYVVTAIEAPNYVRLMRQKETPAIVTTDFGVATLGNRTSVFIAFAAASLLSIGTIVLRVRRA